MSWRAIITFIRVCVVYSTSRAEVRHRPRQPSHSTFAFYPLSPGSHKQINDCLHHVSILNWPFPITRCKPLNDDSDIGVKRSPEVTFTLRLRGQCIHSRWPERLSEVNWPAGDQRLREDKAATWKPDKRFITEREQYCRYKGIPAQTFKYKKMQTTSRLSSAQRSPVPKVLK